MNEEIILKSINPSSSFYCSVSSQNTNPLLLLFIYRAQPSLITTRLATLFPEIHNQKLQLYIIMYMLVLFKKRERIQIGVIRFLQSYFSKFLV